MPSMAAGWSVVSDPGAVARIPPAHFRVAGSVMRGSAGAAKLPLPGAGCDPTDAWHPRPAAVSPARRLVAAVLWQALVDMALAPHRHGRTRRGDMADAGRWFASDDTAWPYSFVNLCGVLELEPAAVRAALRRDGGATALRALVDGRRART
jgi:hypothetical protein